MRRLNSGQINRYSSAFRQKVVSEIESEKYTLAEAYCVYDINGHASIQKSIKKYEKTMQVFFQAGLLRVFHLRLVR